MSSDVTNNPQWVVIPTEIDLLEDELNVTPSQKLYRVLIKLYRAKQVT